MLDHTDSQNGPPLIAVVDDDQSFLRAISRFLRVTGFRVHTFNSPREFLEEVTSTLPECLLVDLRMPEMTGLELQDHLLAQGICLTVILVTACETPQTREQARGLGFSQVLLKPFDGEVLLENLNILGVTQTAQARKLSV